MQKVICADAALSTADSQLAQRYGNVLHSLSSHSVGQARVDQLQWLAWMQQICRVDATDGDTHSVAVCLTPLYNDRMKLLRLAIVRRDGLTFYTRTQYVAAAENEAHGKPRFQGFGTLQASWPQADSELPQWKAWNTAVEQHLQQLARKNRTDAVPAAAATAEWPEDLAQGTDIVLFAQVKDVEHDRIATQLSVEGMGHGAAHPFEDGETLTWLLTARRALTPGDLFAEGSAWQDAIAAASWQQLQKGEQRRYIYPEITGPAARQLRNAVTDPANWTLEHDGLHISYPDYSVAPRMSPPDDAVIPWSTLQPMLRADFPLP